MEDKNLKVSFISRDTRETETNMLDGFDSGKGVNMEIDDNIATPELDTQITLKSLCKYAPSFYLESIPLMFNRMNPYLLNMISLIFIAFYDNATLTAGFGLGNAIFMFFWQTFTQVNGETQGINCSKAYGAEDFKLMRLHFYRGFIWNWLITLLSVVLYTNIDTILLAAGFEAEMTREAHTMIVCMLPALFLQTVNEMLRNYMMSQKITKPFIWINLASFAFFPIGGYYIIYATGWGTAGFGLFKFIVETINVIGLLILMKKYSHEESIRREPLRDILNKKECMQYLVDFGKILLGWYASYFGLEINTILCGLTKDTVIMACWVSYMNLFAIVWTIGAGLAITTRTNCGMKIGDNKPLMARKFAFQGFILAFAYSIVGGTFIILMRNKIAGMFTEVPEVLDVLGYQVMLMGCLAFAVGSGATVSTIYRVIDKAGFYANLMMLNQVVISTSLSVFFLFGLKLGAAGPAYAFLVAWTFTFFVSNGVLAKFNWKKLAKKF